MDWLLNPDIWLSLLTLTALEIVLGIDNLVFISIAVSKLPPASGPSGRALFTNPGGPGGAGLEMPLAMLNINRPELVENFDIYGIDVRGTGRTGYDVAAALRESYDVQVELATHATIVLVIGIAQPVDDLERFKFSPSSTVRSNDTARNAAAPKLAS